MKITLQTFGPGGEQNTEVDVGGRESIALAALKHDVYLYGPCHGTGSCSGCLREVRQNLEALVNVRSGQPPFILDDECPMVRTCLVGPIAEGAVIDGRQSDAMGGERKTV